MKTVLRFLVVVLMLFSANLIYAEGIRVMVSSFEGKPADRDLAREVTIMIAEDVMQSKGYVFKSPTEVMSDVIGADNMGGLRFNNLEDEYSEKNLELLEELAKPRQGFELLNQLMETVDIAIGGKVDRGGNAIKVELMAVDMKDPSHYTPSVSIECDETRLEDEVLMAVRPLLKNVLKVRKIFADKLTDRKWSKVMYAITTIEMRKIDIEMDYTGDRPDPDIQKVNIVPPEGLDANSTTTLKVRSLEGKIIDIVFSYKLGKLEGVRVNTSVPDPLMKTEQSEILTMKSDAGYILKFEFVWSNGVMNQAKLYPALNPFGDHGE